MKRMRLGTKSCSECRRRKVRCIIPEGGKACRECTSHGVTCTPQDASKIDAEPQTLSEVQARLDHLQGLFHTMCKAVDANLEPRTPAEFESATHRLLGQLRLESPPRLENLRGGALGLGLPSPDSPDQDGSSDQSDEAGHLEHAPLVGFFRDSLLITDPGLDDDVSTVCRGANNLDSTHKKRLQALIPPSTVLTSILQHTQKYWALWPLHPIQLSNSDGMSISVVSVAKTFVNESICSDSSATAAKALIWLALCLQQFPKGRKDLLADLPCSATDLVFIYLKESDTLINLDRESGGSVAVLECLVLQLKCYVNLGWPRKAWISNRRALNMGIVLGLHQPTSPPNFAHQNLWATIWRYDRQLSLVLGFPHGLSEPHPTLMETEGGATIEARFMHRISLACGHIVERNQNHQSATYSSTMIIDEELEDAKRTLPPDWWDSRWENAPIELFFARQTMKLYFYQLKSLTHLPYMIKASTDRKYDYSRASVLQAAEGMIKNYRDTRHHPDGPAVTCFLLDFHAFSAGLVLATDLISQRSTWGLEMEEQKWEVILGLAADLKQTSTLLGYLIAEKSALVLEYLYDASHGIYNGPEDYEATIPYFGKVRIRRPMPRVSDLTQLSGGSDSFYPSQTTWGSVELSSNIFNYQTYPELQPDVELDMDWTAILNDNITYDWNGVFDFKGKGGQPNA
jgi:hypothetical protein